jgi:hypothetical protein
LTSFRGMFNVGYVWVFLASPSGVFTNIVVS